jgi:hypothetical protein
MVVSLHHDQGVACTVFRSQIPGLIQTSASTTYMQSFALAEGVEREPLMCAEYFAFG